VISPPLRGKNWVALNGCCDPGWAHRDAILPVNMKLNNSQRFAIDWKRTNDQGEFYTGDKTHNESYVDYGSPVYAVADGTVTSTLDNVDANAQGILPAADPVLAAKLTVENIDGNHIILDIGGGVYAMYAHFIKGSLLVKPGDKVKKGQEIAKLGNTGNANAPHLHFQLMNGPSLLEADGVPYVLDNFGYQGRVAQATMWNADNYLSGSFFGPDRLPTAQPRANELPLLLAIVNFPPS
jgi:murein DD-endopeptidase MepM/ murein hydrolase activator NlpD